MYTNVMKQKLGLPDGPVEFVIGYLIAKYVDAIGPNHVM